MTHQSVFLSRRFWAGFAAIAFLMGVWADAQTPSPAGAAPTFRVDASWPKPLPNNWVLGPVSWVAVDSRNHAWILHRPGMVRATVTGVPAPPVLEFDEQGTLVQAWGGPGEGYEWPATEHGINPDPQGNVWVSGGSVKDTHMLKFSNNGKFLRQIGRAGQKVSNADTANVFKAADMHVNPKISELYVADGEDGGNRRVIVFDSNTGAYKRHWGAYGERPDDAPPPKYDPAAPPPRVFSTSVHCVAQGTDGLLYVCDRNNARIQVFRPDGSFVKEGIIKGTMIPVGGGPADIAFSTDQKLIYVAGANKIWILNRDSLQIVGSFSEPGEQPGQFRNLHTLATDQKGAIYTGELGYISELTGGRRVQKFVPIRP